MKNNKYACMSPEEAETFWNKGDVFLYGIQETRKAYIEYFNIPETVDSPIAIDYYNREIVNLFNQTINEKG